MTAIDVLVFDGCDMLDALGPYEVLHHGGLDVRLVALDAPREVRTAQRVVVLAEPQRADAQWLIVPGGAWDARRSNPGGEAESGRVGTLARERAHAGVQLASVCTGAMWLADAGLVGNRPATTHHQYWDELASYGVDVRRGERVVDDGDLVTAGGICSGLFLGLHLVQRIAGPARREAVEAEIELPTIPGAAADAMGRT